MKRFLASVAIAALCIGAPAFPANLTPDQLTQAVTISNPDLLLIYPSGGPMKSVQWSVAKSLMQSALGATYLQVGNNLSDLASPSTARLNLGLGTAALINTGTSGGAIGLLNGVNSWSGEQFFQSSTTAGASINIGQGVAPTTILPGDVWGTSSALFYRAGSTTVQMQPALGYVPVNKAGDTITGSLVVNQNLELSNTVASNLRTLYLATSGVIRWGAGADAVAEGGTQTGSNFILGRFTNAGAFIDNPIAIDRASGFVTAVDGIGSAAGFSGPVFGNVTGNLTGNVTGNLSGSVTGGSGAFTSLSSTLGFALSNTVASGGRQINFQTTGSTRWIWWAANDAESGGNLGSTMQLLNYSDSGAFMGSPISVARATGVVSMSGGVAANLTGNVTGNVTGTLTGNVNGGTGLFTTAGVSNGIFVGNTVASAARNIFFQTGSTNRWQLFADNTAESGSNAGSNFGIFRFNDAGSGVDCPICINRATGNVIVPDGVFGNLTGNVTGNVSGSSGSTTGNAVTATALQIPRTLAITGDLTWTSPAFDGSGNVTAVGTLASIVGSGSCIYCSLNIDPKGRVTAYANNAPVTTFNSRNGAVVPTSGDYSVGQVTGAAPLASPVFSGSTPTSNGVNLVLTTDSRFGGPTQNSQSAAYGFVLTDAGGQVYHPSADTTARTWTVPANGTIAFPVGTKIDVVNDCSAGTLTIAITTDTLVFFPAGSTGSRALAACGHATLSKIAATRWEIDGINLS